MVNPALIAANYWSYEY